MSYTYKQERQLKRAEFFFGPGNFTKANKDEVQFNAVIDNDNIILISKNVRRVFVKDDKVSLVMATTNRRGIYLKPWQVIRVIINDHKTGEKTVCALVKLNRKFYKTYSFKDQDIIDKDENLGGFLDVYGTEDPTFDVLLEAALIQTKEKIKVQICA